VFFSSHRERRARCMSCVPPISFLANYLCGLRPLCVKKYTKKARVLTFLIITLNYKCDNCISSRTTSALSAPSACGNTLNYWPHDYHPLLRQRNSIRSPLQQLGQITIINLFLQIGQHQKFLVYNIQCFFGQIIPHLFSAISKRSAATPCR